jgi:hypothetical protein
VGGPAGSAGGAGGSAAQAEWSSITAAHGNRRVLILDLIIFAVLWKESESIPFCGWQFSTLKKNSKRKSTGITGTVSI